MCLKKKAKDNVILSGLTYAAENWSLTIHQRDKSAIIQRNTERAILDVTRRDKTRNEDKQSLIEVKDIIQEDVEAKGQ